MLAIDYIEPCSRGRGMLTSMSHSLWQDDEFESMFLGRENSDQVCNINKRSSVMRACVHKSHLRN